MTIELDTPENQAKKVQIMQMDSYVAFRSAILKPTHEEAHLRHILRFYVGRALSKMGASEVYILPSIDVAGQNVVVDVAATGREKIDLAICEPESITPETEELLESLKKVDGIEVTILHSQYGKPGNVAERFKDEIESKKFRVMAVVPPPLDDVYEYDIWMFETTFRELFSGA